jgi:SAM-dependent methyltransferase
MSNAAPDQGRASGNLAALLPLLRCTGCGGTEWATTAAGGAAQRVDCAGCGASHVYRDDVLWITTPDEHPEVVSERRSVAAVEESPDLGGWQDGGAAAAVGDPGLRQAYLSLPYANDLPHFQQPGYFVNVARFAPEFDLIVDQVARATLEGRTGDDGRAIRLLDLGADGTWSTARLAARGFECVALDITDHLALAQVYRDVAPPYALINVDMHEPVFRDEAFDVITAFNVMHHSTRLEQLAGNIGRMLRPGGFLGFVEPYVENQAQKQIFGDVQKEAGINENVHTLDEWHRALTSAGLSLQSWGLTVSFNALYRKGGPARGFWEDAYRAELNVESPRVRASCGSPARFTVDVSNHGTSIWSSAPPRPVRLGFHVRRVTSTGDEMVAFDNPRTELRGFLAPHDSHTYVVEVTLDAPGEYEIEFDLVHETVTWFAERGGVTAKAQLTVD